VRVYVASLSSGKRAAFERMAEVCAGPFLPSKIDAEPKELMRR
jgi:hypothetical protein